MPLIGRKTEEEKERERAERLEKWRHEQAQKELQRTDKERAKRAEQMEKARAAFFETGVGRARAAYERGDHVFQTSLRAMMQQAVIVPMVGGTTTQKTNDPTVVLNAICNEGWEVIDGSFVFIMQGESSRDKMMSSGQNIAVKGEVRGYYLFRRCEANWRQTGNPWEVDPEGD